MPGGGNRINLLGESSGEEGKGKVREKKGIRKGRRAGEKKERRV